MLRSLSILLLLLFSIISKAQNSNYEYVVIPLQFNGFNEPNKYNLNNYARLLFSKKGIKTLPEDRKYWPQELKDKECEVIYLNAKSVKSFLKNKIEITLKDCEGNYIDSKDGESKIKDFKEGYQDAMQKAFQQLRLEKYSFTVSSPNEAKKELSKKENSQTNTNAKSTPEISQTQSLVKGNYFEGENFIIQLAEYNPGQSVFFKVFDKQKNVVGFIGGKISSLKTVYHLTIHLGNESVNTLGYPKQNNWVIDTKGTDDTWQKSIYKLKSN